MIVSYARIQSDCSSNAGAGCCRSGHQSKISFAPRPTGAEPENRSQKEVEEEEEPVPLPATLVDGSQEGALDTSGVTVAAD